MPCYPFSVPNTVIFTPYCGRLISNDYTFSLVNRDAICHRASVQRVLSVAVACCGSLGRRLLPWSTGSSCKILRCLLLRSMGLVFDRVAELHERPCLAPMPSQLQLMLGTCRTRAHSESATAVTTLLQTIAKSFYIPSRPRVPAQTTSNSCLTPPLFPPQMQLNPSSVCLQRCSPL